MKAAAVEDEQMRIALLRGYDILDTAPERDFDEIAELAASICEAPIALVSLVEEDRQWFKASAGTDLTETPIEDSICAHAIKTDGYLEIEDTRTDPRTAQNTLVVGEENICFYAGAVLRDDGGTPMGTLCVLDRTPRVLNATQRKALQVLAKQVMRQIELRSALGAAELLRKEVDHRVKNSLQSLEALIRIQTRNESTPEVVTALEAVQRRLGMVSQLHEALYLSDAGAAVDIASFIEKVLRSSSMQMPSGIAVKQNITPLNLESREASSVGMIVAETMTNSAKYAFHEGAKGTFEVTGIIDGDTYVLTCADDGLGTTSDGAKGTGMGSRIMQAAAQQLGGSLDVHESAKGHVVEVRWPLPASTG